MRKILLTACCAFALGTLQVNAQLVAHYTFANLSGADASGNNLHAQSVSAIGGTLEDAEDHHGTAFEAASWGSLGGGCGYSVPHNSLLNFSNQLSIACWIKLNVVNDSRKIVDKLDGWNTGNFEMDIYNGNLRFWVADGHVEVPIPPVAVNMWLHVVGVYTGSQAILFVNGAQVAVSPPITGSIVTNSSNMLIGLDQASSGDLKGTMDDLRIYGNALSPQEITDLYNEPGPATAECIVSKWTFNNGNADDEVGTDNGTVNGATLTTDRFGNANRAYTFDGLDDNINFDGSHFETADFSISFWFKSPTHNYKTILQKWATANGGLSVDDYPQGPYSNVYTASTTTRGVNLSAYSGNTTGDWHHVVITNKFNDSASFYFDGMLISTSNTSFAGQTITGNPQLVIGSTVANSNYFTGDIDDVLIYNCVIADSSITALYTEGGWGSTSGMDENSSNNVLSVYPNPANSILDVDVNEAAMIHIVNLLGATVYTQQLISGNNSIDVSNLTNGIYFIKTDKGDAVKFVKE